MKVVSLPLKVRFRGVTERQGVLIHGAAGWGEFSPFAEYDDAECVPWLRAALEAAREPFPAPVRTEVAVNTTVPAVGAERAREMVAASGCATAKVKVAEPGQSLAEECARLEAVRDALGAFGHVRVDANGGWDLDTALRALPQLDRAAGGLQYAEQPCRAVDELATLRRRLEIPIAADESIRRSEDPEAVVRAEAADVVVLKVQPLGGVSACLELAERLGLPVVVSSALESSVGIAAGVALAAALPELPYACGLGTVALAVEDVSAHPLTPVNGALPVRRADADGSPCSAAPDVEEWWRARMRRVAQMAGEDLSDVE